jgi:succinate dehydrogenase/fumarate reductase cytochrome b subunit
MSPLFRSFEISSTPRIVHRAASLVLAVLMVSITLGSIDSIATRDLGPSLWAKATQRVTTPA